MQVLRRASLLGLAAALSCSAASDGDKKAEVDSLKACAQMVLSGFLKVAGSRDRRFQGKVADATALCRGGARVARDRGGRAREVRNRRRSGSSTGRSAVRRTDRRSPARDAVDRQRALLVDEFPERAPPHVLHDEIESTLLGDGDGLYDAGVAKTKADTKYVVCNADSGDSAGCSTGWPRYSWVSTGSGMTARRQCVWKPWCAMMS